MGRTQCACGLFHAPWHGYLQAAAGSVDEGRVVCWPGIGAIDTSSQLSISPLDLYVVERMGRTLDEWLLRKPIERYGLKLWPLPSAVKRLTDGWPEQFEGVLNNPCSPSRSAERTTVRGADGNSARVRECSGQYAGRVRSGRCRRPVKAVRSSGAAHRQPASRFLLPM